MSTRVVVLGATGSIGRQTLEVCAYLGAEVVGLAVRRPRPELVELLGAYPEARLVVVGGSGEERQDLSTELGRRVSFGTDSLLDLAREPGTTVVNGIVGSAGLRASVAAAQAGNRLALANKESLVAGGPVLLAAVASGGAELIPVDSEHSAIFQLLERVAPETVSEVVLTASGGPFRGWSRERLADASPAQALEHPTWNMGARISIDSATLANKGLEVIEAHYLFDVSFDQIRVLVHPQSIVHSLIRLVDGSMLAHLGPADMRIPIQLALTYPRRRETPAAPFDLAGVDLTFEEPDTATFRALELAYHAGRTGGVAPAVFNAADEIAVEAFLAGRLGFLGIAEVIERTLEIVEPRQPGNVDDVIDADREARQAAAGIVASRC